MRVHRIAIRVHVRDEVADAALVVELLPPVALTLVQKHDAQAAREKGRLAQPLHECVARPLELFEDLEVGQERDRRPVLVLARRTDLLHVARRHTAAELLAIDDAVAPHLGSQGLRERVDDRDADSVQPARDLVPVAAELAAGVQLGEDHGQRRQSLVRHHVDGDA